MTDGLLCTQILVFKSVYCCWDQIINYTTQNDITYCTKFKVIYANSNLNVVLESLHGLVLLYSAICQRRRHVL